MIIAILNLATFRVLLTLCLCLLLLLLLLLLGLGLGIEIQKIDISIPESKIAKNIDISTYFVWCGGDWETVSVDVFELIL